MSLAGTQLSLLHARESEENYVTSLAETTSLATITFFTHENLEKLRNVITHENLVRNVYHFLHARESGETT